MRIFKIQKTKKSPINVNKTETLNGLQYECIFSECKENFLNFKLWKLHFDKHVNIFYKKFIKILDKKKKTHMSVLMPQHC